MDGFGSYGQAINVSAPKHEVAKVVRGPILCVRVSAATNED
jgi:hypothetical protein